MNLDPNPVAPPQDPTPPSQQEPAKEGIVPQDAPSGKNTAVPEAEVASQGFQQDLDSTVMPAEGAAKAKEGTTTSEAKKTANQTPKLQIKLKK